MRIRQVALVAANLEPVLEGFQRLFGIDLAFRDPGVGLFGLCNGVMPVGEQFLEVVSPKDAGTAAGRYLERRHGDGGYMVIFQTHDLAARRQQFTDQNVRTAWEVALEDIATVHLHPRDTGGAIVSVDEARPWESWRWAGPEWQTHVRTERVTGIAGVEIQSEDPSALAERWMQIFRLARGAANDTLVLDDGGWIRFCKADDDRGEGIRSIALRASDAAAIRELAMARGVSVDGDGAVIFAGARFLLV